MKSRFGFIHVTVKLNNKVFTPSVKFFFLPAKVKTSKKPLSNTNKFTYKHLYLLFHK